MSKQINNDNIEKGNLEALTQKPTSATKITTAKPKTKKSFIDKWRTSKFWLARASYQALYSVWLAFMAIGTVIVWLISLLFI